MIKFKKIGLFLVGMLLALSCHAVDYSLHFGRPARAYRVALGSGNAPSAADMSAIGIRPGDIVINTDDDVYFLMHATNVYTEISAAGLLTATSIDSSAIAVATGRNFLSGVFSLDVTNGQAITLTATDSVVVLTGILGADGTTNTITINQPYPVGYDILIRVASGSTNSVLIADSTTVLSLGADVALGPTDTLRIYTVATNEAVKISTSDN